MSKYLSFFLFAAAFVSLLGWLGSSMIKSDKKIPDINARLAPDFALQNYKGGKTALSAYKGKVVYLKFWASWCGDCIKQVVPQRHLEEELLAQPGIVFLNVSLDKEEDDWRKAVERNKLQAIELISRGGQEGNINELYEVDEIPHYVLIGRDGKIIDAHAPFPSELDADYFKDYL